jgi:hypothetical protein
MPVRPPQSTSGSLTAVGVLAVLLALASGWYVVALGWSVAFLLSEGWLMAIYSLILLFSPALFTIVAILAFRGKRRATAWFLAPLGVKWLAVFVYSFIEGGWELLWSNLPVVNAITRLSDEFMTQYRVEQLVMLVIQFDVEPLLLVVMAALLARRTPRRRRQ